LEDSERVFCRWWRVGDDGNQTMLVVLPAAEHPSPSVLDRLAHEFGLKAMLVLEDAGGKPLERLLDVHVRCGHTEKVHAKPGVYFSLFVVAPQEEECNCSCP